MLVKSEVVLTNVVSRVNALQSTHKKISSGFGTLSTYSSRKCFGSQVCVNVRVLGLVLSYLSVLIFVILVQPENGPIVRQL